MIKYFNNKKIVIGVTGSIAAYKAVDLASQLKQRGAIVDVIMTETATKFIHPLSFQAITHREVVVDLYDPSSEIGMDHLVLANQADLFIVAPATANIVSKAALGIADNALISTLLATEAPVLVCPAMDGDMFQKPQIKNNIEKLIEFGFHVLGPNEGRLASGNIGKGRLVEIYEIQNMCRYIFGIKGDYRGKNIVVTSGGTKEHIDPVRYISNNSSGKMGNFIAEAARDRGAFVQLVSSSLSAKSSAGIELKKVKTADQMLRAVELASTSADVLIMAAAVSDWKPIDVSEQKIKKDGQKEISIQMTQSSDILSTVLKPGLFKVGFAAETEDIINNASEKLNSKGLDLIVANDISDDSIGFESDYNSVTIIDKNGIAKQVDRSLKYEVANLILDEVLNLYV
ncbi:MAG: bifunctional phosphopantothenoylcysteine decarboxylase/phosphopantothenate--cysteine ligase CoaBC [SAR202 cluster bacterium]|nr:bifunctional phosphopantothenoylcysteine decarboxylase/phosphopantothenate--cysteine ligase CoaBC [SAR202 cluster bacterium]|tara:strand:+ start:28927 stop:30126 length:1200 start_codon:yes stop_codon:yes gene_type:complete